MYDWSPKQIVDELDRYIIGQSEAKRAVAIALRNRYRRNKLDEAVREEITPKNIIMMGPTGCGKTEIARRLAKLVEAPFVKVEATKFTEVGYVGRDVDSIVRDLVEASIRLVKNKKEQEMGTIADAIVEQRLLKVLVPIRKKEQRQSQNPIELLLNPPKPEEEEEGLSQEEKSFYMNKRDEVLAELRAKRLEDTMLEIEVDETPKLGMDMGGVGVDININDMMGGLMPKKKKKRRMKVSQVRKIFKQEELDKLIDMDEVIEEAIQRAEQDGIIFIDEIDKIAGKNAGGGPDVSREGVQRDILPIVEGCTVNSKYGPIKTDYMLFIAAGAFHVAKVTDLIPELQGRFPITVSLKSLTVEDFKCILTQPENAVVKQYSALLGADNIKLVFKEDAITALAQYAYDTNEQKENIGARRLHTVMESLLEDISFNANGKHPEIEVVIDEQYVKDRLIGSNGMATNLQKYLL